MTVMQTSTQAVFSFHVNGSTREGTLNIGHQPAAVTRQPTTLDTLADAAAANGGNRAFTALITACRPMITAQVRRIAFRSPLLQDEDLRQVAALAVYESLKSWTLARGTFSTFASRVIRCRLLSTIRSHRLTDTRPTFHTIDHAQHTAADASPPAQDTIAMQDEADAILSTMTVRDRTIVLAIANGKSYREIGQHFGISVGQVDNFVQRLRRGHRQHAANRLRF